MCEAPASGPRTGGAFSSSEKKGNITSAIHQKQYRLRVGLFTFCPFTEKVKRREKDCGLLEKGGGKRVGGGRGEHGWTNISTNAKSAGFILKRPYILIVICAARFIMLVLDAARWERGAALD